LTTLPMWQGGPLASFSVFFSKKKNQSKSCHVGKGSEKLCFEVAMYHISLAIFTYRSVFYIQQCNL